MKKQTANLRALGKTNIQISPIGLGCWQFSGGKGMSGNFWDVYSNEHITAIVKEALAGGINWFDTAEFYGHGASEKSLSDALQQLKIEPQSVVVATKWWPVLKFASNIAATIDDRLQCLSPYSVDLHMVHQPYSLSSVAAQMNVMADLMDAGKIKSVGVSNFSAKAMMKAHEALDKRGYSLACNQVRYSLMFREAEKNGVLTAAKEIGATLIAWSPLEQGMLSGKFHKDSAEAKKINFMRKQMYSFSNKRIEASRPLVEALTKIGAVHEASPSQVALNWLINFHGDTVVAIPGASRPEQVQQNVGAMGFCLSQDEMGEINGLSQRFL